MPNEHALGPLSQIPKGEGRTFAVDGIRVAVFRTHADEVFATQPNCPHRNGPLADGLLGSGPAGPNLVCPLHDRMFDLRTGAGSEAGCDITVFPTRLGPDGTILLTLIHAMA